MSPICASGYNTAGGGHAGTPRFAWRRTLDRANRQLLSLSIQRARISCRCGGDLVNEARREPRPRRRTSRLAADVSHAEAAELSRRYKQGDTLSVLMENFDGSYRMLRNVLEAQGVEFRENRPMLRPAPPGMVETYRSGKSIIETGRRFGLGRDATKRMLLDAGVKLRGPGRPAQS